MKLKHAIVTMVATLFGYTLCQAQHTDIEFGYVREPDAPFTPIDFEIEGDDLTSDGILIFEGGMEDNSFGDFAASEPGFATNAGHNLTVNASDRIYLRVLDASLHSTYGINFGVGFMNYFDPSDGTLKTLPGFQLKAKHNFGPLSVQDLSIGGTMLDGDNPLGLQVANGTGGIHSHFKFDLLNDATAPLGAYGILVRLESDFFSNGYSAFGTTELESAPFWMVFNHGMDEDDFDDLALPAFGAVPEPSGLLLLGSLALGTVGFTRRRRS